VLQSVCGKCVLQSVCEKCVLQSVCGKCVLQSVFEKCVLQSVAGCCILSQSVRVCYSCYPCLSQLQADVELVCYSLCSLLQCVTLVTLSLSTSR